MKKVMVEARNKAKVFKILTVKEKKIEDWIFIVSQCKNKVVTLEMIRCQVQQKQIATLTQCAIKLWDNCPEMLLILEVYMNSKNLWLH